MILLVEDNEMFNELLERIYSWKECQFNIFEAEDAYAYMNS